MVPTVACLCVISDKEATIEKSPISRLRYLVTGALEGLLHKKTELLAHYDLADRELRALEHLSSSEERRFSPLRISSIGTLRS
jgi:hypothetical protein